MGTARQAFSGCHRGPKFILTWPMWREHVVDFPMHASLEPLLVGKSVVKQSASMTFYSDLDGLFEARRRMHIRPDWACQAIVVVIVLARRATAAASDKAGIR